MWKGEAGRQEKKLFLFVCLFAEAGGAAFAFPVMHSVSTFKIMFYLPSTL